MVFITGGERARFDTAPVEAQAMVRACLEAYRFSNDDYWLKKPGARLNVPWSEDLHLPVYDPTTGVCRDGCILIARTRIQAQSLRWLFSSFIGITAGRKYNKI